MIIRERLGAGAHGEVLLGEVTGGSEVAIKLGLRRGAIAREAAVLHVMAGAQGFPRVLHYQPDGQGAQGGVLVMELLGPSLEELCEQSTLSALEAVKVGRTCLCRLQLLHLAGFVHNDVKPANFLLGTRSAEADIASQIHLIDFGLSTLVAGADSVEKVDTLIGTPSFASLAAHHHRRPMRPVDDVESLVYMLAYLAAGSLPWQGLAESTVAAMKRAMLVEGCEMLTDTCAATGDVHAFTLVNALHALWAEVMRCRGEAPDESRVANINYDACLAALRDAAANGVEGAISWELSGRDAPTPPMWSP